MVILRLLGLAAWLYAGWYALQVAGEPDMLLPVVLFWTGTALAFWILLRGAGRARRRPADDVVTVVAPRGAPTGTPSIHALPEHCRHLFGERP